MRLGAPQPGHWQRLLTSLRPLLASCLIRFLEWETLFFGTARKIPSQMSSSSVGMVMLIPGRARPSVGSRRPARPANDGRRGIGSNAGEAIRGRRAAIAKMSKFEARPKLETFLCRHGRMIELVSRRTEELPICALATGLQKKKK